VKRTCGEWRSICRAWLHVPSMSTSITRAPGITAGTGRPSPRVLSPCECELLSLASVCSPSPGADRGMTAAGFGSCPSSKPLSHAAACSSGARTPGRRGNVTAPAPGKSSTGVNPSAIALPICGRLASEKLVPRTTSTCRRQSDMRGTDETRRLACEGGGGRACQVVSGWDRLVK